MLWRTTASAARMARVRASKSKRPAPITVSEGSFLALIKKREWKGATIEGVEARGKQVFWKVEHPSGARCLLLIPNAEP